MASLVQWQDIAMDAPAAPTPSAIRRVGPYGLRQLLGKSTAGMTWLATDERLRDEVLLCLPRQALVSSDDADAWRQTALRLTRMDHSRFARIRDTGFDGQWPYLVIEAAGGRTLQQRIDATGWPSAEEAATWTAEILEALVALHDGNLTHHDVGMHTVLVDEQGHATLMPPVCLVQPSAQDRDIVLAGLMLHGLLLRRPAHDLADLPTAATRVSEEIVRLPYNTPVPVNDALRAIVNRATERHSSRRFVSARGMLRAHARVAPGRR